MTTMMNQFLQLRKNTGNDILELKLMCLVVKIVFMDMVFFYCFSPVRTVRRFSRRVSRDERRGMPRSSLEERSGNEVAEEKVLENGIKVEDDNDQDGEGEGKLNVFGLLLYKSEIYLFKK